MRDAAHTAENFSIWFSRVNNLQNIPVPPMFNGSYNFTPQFASPQQQQQPHQSSEAEQTGKKRKASGDQEGKKKRAVKEKKPHDPNAPKRPPSAYLLFQNEVRQTVKGQHPDMPYGQVLAEISKLWHALTPDERAVCELHARCHVLFTKYHAFSNLQPYMQATADSKVIYEKAKANYDALSPTDAKEVSTKSLKSKTPAAVRPHYLDNPHAVLTSMPSHPWPRTNLLPRWPPRAMMTTRMTTTSPLALVLTSRPMTMKMIRTRSLSQPLNLHAKSPKKRLSRRHLLRR